MYIGQTTDINKRWQNNRINAYKSCTFIFNELKKYGWDAFEHIILEDNIPDEELDEREKYWIKKYHTFIGDPEYSGGFNLTAGGDGTRGPKLSRRGIRPDNYEQLIQDKLTPIKTINSGEWNGVPFHENQTWNSITECANYFNVARTSVSSRLFTINHLVHGPLFVYVDKANKYDENIRLQNIQKSKEFFVNNGKRLTQTHKTGSRIDYRIYCEETGQYFDKVSDCLKEFSMSRSALNNHILYPDKRPSVRGYHFKRVSKTNTDS